MSTLRSAQLSVPILSYCIIFPTFLLETCEDDVVLGLACTDAIVYALLGFPFKFYLMGIIIGFVLRVPYLFLS